MKRWQKFICNLYNKENYAVHVRALNQSLNYGLKLKKMYGIIKLNREGWLKTYIIGQCLSQDFKGNLDIDYIWVFISISLNRGIGGPKKANLSFPNFGKSFYDALNTPRQSRLQKTFKK